MAGDDSGMAAKEAFAAALELLIDKDPEEVKRGARMRTQKANEAIKVANQAQAAWRESVQQDWKADREETEREAREKEEREAAEAEARASKAAAAAEKAALMAAEKAAFDAKVKMKREKATAKAFAR